MDTLVALQVVLGKDDAEHTRSGLTRVAIPWMKVQIVSHSFHAYEPYMHWHHVSLRLQSPCKLYDVL